MKFLSVLKSRKGKPLEWEKLELRVDRLCKNYGILLLYIFGSYARENADKLSDLDLAFLAPSDFNFKKKFNLIGEFQRIFEEEAIDLIDLRKAPLTLVHRILKEGRCLYAPNLKTRIEFEMRKETLYFDTYLLRKGYFEALKKRVENGSFGYR